MARAMGGLREGIWTRILAVATGPSRDRIEQELEDGSGDSEAAQMCRKDPALNLAEEVLDELAARAEGADGSLDRLAGDVGRVRRLRAELVRANLGLVGKIAGRLRGRGLTMDDLLQEGHLALLHAVDLYDPDRGPRLGTYAAMWISRSIVRAIDRKGHLVRRPVELNVLGRKIAARRDELERLQGRKPTAAELAEELGVSEEKINRVLQSDRLHVVPFEPVTPEDWAPSNQKLIPRQQQDLERILDRRRGVQKVRRTMESLDHRERRIIRARYGLEEGAPATLRELGAELEVSGERVRQLQKRALRRLRKQLAEVA